METFRFNEPTLDYSVQQSEILELEVNMKSFNIKNISSLTAILILTTGLVLFVLLFTPLRILSIALITIGALFIAISSYSKFSNTDEHPFRSKARDKVFKDLNKL